MRAIAIFALMIAVLSGCGLIQRKQALDDYNAKIAANQSEYQNGQILLSEKLRRDYLAGLQYKQINAIEAKCTHSYIYLAQRYERGMITEQRFNDRRDSLELACAKSYATGDITPASMWIIGDVYSNK